MDELCPGLYEQVINRELSEKLKELSEKLFRREGIDEAEAPAILSEYAAAVIQKSLELLGAQNGLHSADSDTDPQNAPRPALTAQIRLINAIVQLLGSSCSNDEYFQQQQIDDRGEQLLSVYAENDARILDPNFTDYERPQTSLRWSTLFTGYEHGIRLDGELRREIRSADSVDLLISFIKYSGLRLIYEDLKAFTDQPGKKLRVVTTTYMGATDLKAIEQLSRLRQTEIYISYEERATRHHAKAYIFRRRSGFGTAYIGSSNISSPALGTGLEWNLKVTEQELPEVFKIITATFESYQNDQAFERFDHSEQATARLCEALRQRETGNSRRYQAFFDLRPYWYQQEILDRLEAERELHRHFKNLVVAATGTGKTLIAAFDYRRCAQKLGHLPTLLFVAHRKEILEQALATIW